MYGLDAISANNGWSMSIVGVSIVFTGLTLLSIGVAQLHKILNIWENKEEILDKTKSFFKKKKERKTISPVSVSVSFIDRTRQFSLLVKTLKDPFSLSKLLELAVLSGLSKPYATIVTLLDFEVIYPDKKGFFHWNQTIINNYKLK